MRELTEDEKLDIQRKIEHFLAAGNPPSFLREMGIIDPAGNIDYQRVHGMFATIKQNEDEILELLDAGGYDINQQKKTGSGGLNEADNGIISK